MSIVQMVLIGVIVLVVFGIVVLVFINAENAKKRRMMSVIQGHSASPRVGKVNEKDRRREDLAKKLKEAKDDDERKGKKKKTTLSLMLEQAGLSISVKKFWLFSVLGMVLFIVLAKMMGQPPLVIGLAGIVGLLGFPRLVLKKMAARRQKKFLTEFPDALEATVRLLKAGMPVSEAIKMIAREFDGPVGDEMGRIYDKQKIGVSLAEAALEATRRMPLTEMQMFATGLSIQAQTGSSLSEVLTNLSAVIRSRFRLKRKIKALSSEAIASASIIGALPILVASGMYFINYDYIEVLFTDSFGKLLLAGAVVWMGMGIMMMKAMINFKV